MNDIETANSTMSFTTESLMGIIHKSMSNELPNGRASRWWRSCLTPRDTISRVELRRQLNQIKIKANADPATYFEQISVVENKVNSAQAANRIHHRLKLFSFPSINGSLTNFLLLLSKFDINCGPGLPQQYFEVCQTTT